MRAKSDFRLLAAGAFALGLSGCGGGGGDNPAPSSFAPTTTATPSPPSPPPVSTPLSTASLFDRENGESFRFVCSYGEDGPLTMLRQPQTGGALEFDRTTDTFHLNFENLVQQFGAGDLVQQPANPFDPAPRGPIYENLSDTQDAMFRLAFDYAPQLVFFPDDPSQTMETVQFFTGEEFRSEMMVGEFDELSKIVNCLYGEDFAGGQLPSGSPLSSDSVFNYLVDNSPGNGAASSRLRALEWTATFEPQTSELSFLLAIGASRQVGGTGSCVFGGCNSQRLIVDLVISGRANVDPVTGYFEGVLQIPDEFALDEDEDIDFDGSGITVSDARFAGSFFGEQGSELALSYNLITLIEGTSEASRYYRGVVGTKLAAN